MEADVRAALRDRWLALLGSFPCAEVTAREVFDDLARRYGESTRHYHTLLHIRDVLRIVEELEPAPSPALLLAVWMHDVVYDSRASDNEARSAQFALDFLPRLLVPEPIPTRTAHLIQLTRTHEAHAEDREAAVLLDADLSILGAARSDYDDYAAAIRKEYDWVSETDYRAGRRQILERFLGRSRIYRTERMYQQREAFARANLQREITALIG